MLIYVFFDPINLRVVLQITNAPSLLSECSILGSLACNELHEFAQIQSALFVWIRLIRCKSANANLYAETYARGLASVPGVAEASSRPYSDNAAYGLPKYMNRSFVRHDRP